MPQQKVCYFLLLVSLLYTWLFDLSDSEVELLAARTALEARHSLRHPQGDTQSLDLYMLLFPRRNYVGKFLYNNLGHRGTSPSKHLRLVSATDDQLEVVKHASHFSVPESRRGNRAREQNLVKTAHCHGVSESSYDHQVAVRRCTWHER